MATIAEAHLTDTVSAARDDARAQGGRTADAMPYLPAGTSPFVPDGVAQDRLVWAETVAPGGYTHRVVARGTRIRLDDPTGDACAHVFLLRAGAPFERLNVADTVKIPWQAYLGAGHPLLSGDGRVLATVAADSSARHDTFCGTSSDAWNDAKYGDARPEGPTPSGQGLFTLAAAKHGLTLRDLGPSVSFFQGVRVGEDGTLAWQGSAGRGTAVELVAELPLILLIANVPHPLDPRDGYVVGPLRVHAWRGEPTAAGDAGFAASPELTRAYLNTIDDHEARV
jgi:urea carboxylase-associated protein 2